MLTFSPVLLEVVVGVEGDDAQRLDVESREAVHQMRALGAVDVLYVVGAWPRPVGGPAAVVANGHRCDTIQNET